MPTRRARPKTSTGVRCTRASYSVPSWFGMKVAMADPTEDYSLCGWRVASAIELPELPRIPAGPGAAEITIGFGEVPERLDDPVLTTPTLQMDGAGVALYRIEGVAGYLVEHGRRITIAPELTHDARDIRMFLLGSVFGFLCHHRGVLPIHAAAAEIEGR